MFQESTQCNAKALMLLSLILGFGFVAIVSLSRARQAEDPTITMASAMAAPSTRTLAMQPAKTWGLTRNQYNSMQPLRAWQPSQAGQFMQPMKAQQHAQPVSALSPSGKQDYSTYPVTNDESQSMQGRRDAMLGAFAFALAAANSRAAMAADPVAAANSRAANEKFFDATSPTALPKAEDFTRFDKVQSKEGAVATKGTGAVAAPPAVPAAAALGAVLLAGVPVLLSPGEKALEAQIQNEKGQRGFLEKQRQNLKKNTPRYTTSGRKYTQSSRQSQSGRGKQSTQKKKGLFR